MEFSGSLARWRLHVMKFDLEVVDRLGSNQRTADAMPRLPRVSLQEGEGNEAVINDDISTFGILRQVSHMKIITQEERPTPLDEPKTAQLRDA